MQYSNNSCYASRYVILVVAFIMTLEYIHISITASNNNNIQIGIT